MELGRVRPWCDAIDFNHMFVMASLLFYSAIKLGCLKAGQLFMTFEGSHETIFFSHTFDSFEVLTHSPRFLAVWTMSYMNKINFLAQKDSLCAV